MGGQEHRGNIIKTTTTAMNNDSFSGVRKSQIFLTVIMGIIAMSFWTYHDIENKMAWYGTFHREPWNQIIHFFGVPGILWSAMLYGIHVPIPIPIANNNNKKYNNNNDEIVSFLPGLLAHHVNFALLSTLIYAISYLCIDPVGGILYLPFLYTMYASVVLLWQKDQSKFQQEMNKKFDADSNNNNNNKNWFGTGSLLRWALGIHIFCWYVQIHPGHQIIEGAKPALMDSLGDALTAAPLFAYHELLWYVGLRKELHHRVLTLVAEYTNELCAGGSAMRVCSNIKNM